MRSEKWFPEQEQGLWLFQIQHEVKQLMFMSEQDWQKVFVLQQES
jgi:hypothetical protein